MTSSVATRTDNTKIPPPPKPTPTAMEPPTIDPTRPRSVVNQIGIGSGPGTARRPRAPTTKAEIKMTTMLPRLTRGA
jgi:hypothetical protein